MKADIKGNALPVVLIMMLVLTVLAISALKMAQAHYRMAGIEQFHTMALEAAESAINSHFENTVLATRDVGTSVSGAPVNLGDDLTGTPSDVYNGVGPVPTGGASLANNAFSAYHFEMQATGTAPASTSVEVVQGIYLVARGQN